jgi:hypothetical protein
METIIALAIGALIGVCMPRLDRWFSRRRTELRTGVCCRCNGTGKTRYET